MNRILIFFLILAATHLNVGMCAAETYESEQDPHRSLRTVITTALERLGYKCNTYDEQYDICNYNAYNWEHFNYPNPIILVIYQQEERKNQQGENDNQAEEGDSTGSDDMETSAESYTNSECDGASMVSTSTEDNSEEKDVAIYIFLFMLSVVNTLLILYLLTKRNKKVTPDSTNRWASVSDVNAVKQDILSLRNLFATESLKEDDVIRIVNTKLPKTTTSNHNPQPVISSPGPTPKPVQTEESIDTLEYNFQENKFILTRDQQQIFVIHKKGNDYTFSLKNDEVCQEIMSMLNAYSKCISVMGNTSSANGIGSITPGVLHPTGDGRSFSIASPITINFI